MVSLWFRSGDGWQGGSLCFVVHFCLKHIIQTHKVSFMKRQNHLALLFAFCPTGVLPVTAQQTFDKSSMIIEKNDGTDHHVIALEDVRRITFKGGNMNFDYTGSQDSYPASVSMQNVAKCLFWLAEDTGVQTLSTTNGGGATIRISDGKLTVYGLTAGNNHTVNVYNLDGVVVWQLARFDAAQSIDIHSWAPGVYVIKVDRENFKVVK